MNELDPVQSPSSTPEVGPESPSTKAAAGFVALGLLPELERALTALGYEEPTPIQSGAIPPMLDGKDLLGQAATGTGKTAAFALPLLHRIAKRPAERNAPRALVLVPTRELAMQVAEAIHKYGKELRTRVLPIYGGQSIVQQLRALDRGVDVVVATPGRALDHLQRETLKLDAVEVVVLDEADEMLDMGFAEDLDAILSKLPEKRQTALFSATLAPRILAIAKRHLCDPVEVRLARERPAAGELPRVRQIAYVVPRGLKPVALGRVLDAESPTSTIVFCRTRVEVDDLTEAMNAHGWRAEALHGGLSQEHRDRVMKRFRSETTDLLVATDVAARGLDIGHVTHVVNYDVPTAPDAYVHRIGRTGRAGREGVAITLIDRREQRLLQMFQRATQQPISIEPLPSIADVRSRRMQALEARLRATALGGGIAAFRPVAERLAAELDPLDVVAAALELAHRAEHPDEGEAAEEKDVLLEPAPRRDDPRERPEFRRPMRGDRFAPRGGHGGEFDQGPRGRGFDRGFDRQAPRERGPIEREAFELGGGFDLREHAGGRGRGGFGGPGPAGDRGPRMHGFEPARLFVGVGRMDGLRPGDLVGAIANEAGVPGSAIGAIRIQDRFTIVEVPEDFADEIVQALRNTTIRGRRANIRRDQYGG